MSKKFGRTRELTEASSTDDMARAIALTENIADKAIAKWSRHEVGANLTKLAENDLRKARRVALAVEKQSAQLKEATIQSGDFIRPETVLKIVNYGVTQSNRDKFASEVQLKSADDAIFILERTQGSTLRDGTAGNNIYENQTKTYQSSLK